jgi:Family of unknown function (DUF6263)
MVMNAAAFAQYKLEYKATGTSPLHYKAHTTLQTTESMMGQEAKVSVLSDQVISITSVKSGKLLLYDITIDSSNNMALMPNGDTSRTSSPSVGKTKRATVRPDGEEVSSVWLDSSFAGSAAGQMKDFGSLFFRLPAKEVALGSTWNQTKTDTVATGGGEGNIVVTSNSEYKLVSEETVTGINCVKIQFTGKILLKGTTSYQGIEFAINGTGTISGTAMFDYKSGRVVKIDGNSEQDLTMVSSGQQKMTIPMNQKTDYELSLER